MQFIIKAVAWIITIFTAYFSFVGTPTLKRDEPLRVTAYLVCKSAEQVANMDKSHLDCLTDIIIFETTGFSTEGKLETKPDFAQIVKNLRDMTAKNGTRLHVCLHGPGWDHDGTYEERMDSQSENHKKAFESGVFEENIKAFLEKYGLDGVSFNYEFPLTAQREIEFSDFLVSLDKTLGDDYLISAAVSHGWCRNTTPEAIEALDMVELMDYDLFDRIGEHSTVGIGKFCVEEMLKTGFKKEQIDLGLAFYARPTDQSPHWYDYIDYYDQLDFFGYYEDKENGVTATFNTPLDIYLKTRWCVRNNIGGVFAWHYSCDVPADNSASLMNQVVRAKEGKPFWR